MDRMEALMEKLIEVVYYQQESTFKPKPKWGKNLPRMKGDTFKFYEEEEHLSDDYDEILLNPTPAEIEIVDETEPLEEYVMDETSDSGPARKRFKTETVEAPKEINVNEFVMPLQTVADFEMFDELVNKDTEVREKVVWPVKFCVQSYSTISSSFWTLQQLW